MICKQVMIVCAPILNYEYFFTITVHGNLLYKNLDCHSTTYTLSYVILCIVHLTLFEILIYGILHEMSPIELLSVIINKTMYIHEQ